MATPLRRRIYHEADPYAKGNDIAGDVIAASRHMWADRDLQQCRYGRLIVTHWADPEREGWKYRGRVVERPFRQIPLYRVVRMTCQGKWHIRTAEQAMRDAKRLGVPGIEFELKFTPTQRQMNRLAAAARRVYGADWAKHIEIKMLQQFEWEIGLARAKAAGFTTTLIRFTGDAERLSRNFPFVDHYRR